MHPALTTGSCFTHLSREKALNAYHNHVKLVVATYQRRKLITVEQATCVLQDEQLYRSAAQKVCLLVQEAKIVLSRYVQHCGNHDTKTGDSLRQILVRYISRINEQIQIHRDMCGKVLGLVKTVVMGTVAYPRDPLETLEHLSDAVMSHIIAAKISILSTLISLHHSWGLFCFHPGRADLLKSLTSIS